MNNVFLVISCAVFIAGCSEPAPKRTFKESDLIPPESRQSPGVQMPAGAAQDAQQQGALLPVVQKAEGALQDDKKEPEGRKNPFLREEEERLFESTKDRVQITTLDLSAIFYSPGASSVIIDGRFYKEGDIVDNKKIVSISPEEVILKDAQSVYVLQLQGVLQGLEY